MKIGIMGAGNIASIVTPAIKKVKGAELYAVASRTLEKAQDFAEKFNFERAYGSYEELVSDQQVELVYVCTPHTLHCDCMMLAISHGKNVISEKPFTINARQAKRVISRAREEGVFAGEAMWPRYMPSRIILEELLKSGYIGRPTALTADVFYSIADVPRLTDPALAGGALLDVGIYGLNFALTCFGWDIERIESSARLTDTGVDGMENITLYYTDGRMAVINSGIFAHSRRQGTIYGDRGYIVVDNIVNPGKIEVFDRQNRPINLPGMSGPVCGEDYTGYESEFAEAIMTIESGGIEPPSMPHSETIKTLELMDRLRHSWGVVYPGE